MLYDWGCTATKKSHGVLEENLSWQWFWLFIFVTLQEFLSLRPSSIKAGGWGLDVIKVLPALELLHCQDLYRKYCKSTISLKFWHFSCRYFLKGFLGPFLKDDQQNLLVALWTLATARPGIGLISVTPWQYDDQQRAMPLWAHFLIS